MPSDIKWMVDGLQSKSKKKGLLAQAMRLRPGAVSEILKGDRDISLDEALRASAYLEVPLPKPPSYEKVVPNGAPPRDAPSDSSRKQPHGSDRSPKPDETRLLHCARVSIEMTLQVLRENLTAALTLSENEVLALAKIAAQASEGRAALEVHLRQEVLRRPLPVPEDHKDAPRDGPAPKD